MGASGQTCSVLRMERAAELLAATEITVTRVGEEVGYPDVSHFMQVFRKYYDTTPGQYRADGGGTPSLPERFCVFGDG